MISRLCKHTALDDKFCMAHSEDPFDPRSTGEPAGGGASLATPGDCVGTDATPSVSRWAIHRRLYDWVLSFAHKKHSSTALFLFSFSESSFFPIPPDVLLAPMCLGHRRRAIWFATVTTIASVLGAFLGYAIGYGAIDVAQLIPGITREKINVLACQFEQTGHWYVFIAALTPIPFKLLTITSGFATMNLVVFALACLIGRATRFYAVAVVIWLIGPKAMPLIDRYFNWLCVAFVILLVGGFLIIKLMH